MRCVGSPRRGFSCCGAQALGTQPSVVVVHWLSFSEARGIFLDQGLTSVPCLARWILNHWTTGKAQCLWFRTLGVQRHCGLEPEQRFPNSVSVEGLCRAGVLLWWHRISLGHRIASRGSSSRAPPAGGIFCVILHRTTPSTCHSA